MISLNSSQIVNISKDRLFILEKEGSWIQYEKKVGCLHRECINDYALKKKMPNSDPEFLVDKTGSVIFYNLDDKTLVTYMPDKISDDQLYQLDLLVTMNLDGVNHMEVRKIGNEVVDFSLCGDVSNKFSNHVIQSYYENNDVRKK